MSLFVSVILLLFSQYELARAQSLSNFTFSAVGDMGCNGNSYSTVYKMANMNPDLIIGLGDYSYVNSQDCWLEMVEPIKDKMEITMGNHDDENPEKLQALVEAFDLDKQYYSFDRQNIHFLMMSTQLPYEEGSEQYDFVVQDLEEAASNPDIDWIVVALHKFFYGSKSTAASGKSSLVDAYHDLFDRYNVDLVLQGHLHAYERSYPLLFNEADPDNPIITDNHQSVYIDPEGPVFVIIGTGGAPLHSITDRVYYKAADEHQFGSLFVTVFDEGKKLNAKFYANAMKKPQDDFTIEKTGVVER